MLGFVIWHEQFVQQFLAVPPVARAHLCRLRQGEQQLARLADHPPLFLRGQFHHLLRTLIPILHQSPTLFRRRVQRQSHQRGARQQYQQQQAQAQTGNKPADDFSHTTIFHATLDESGRHCVSTLVGIPKMSYPDFGRGRKTDQSNPANGGPFSSACHHERLGDVRENR